MKNPSYRHTLVEGLPPALRERVQARLASERKEQEKSNPTKPPKMRRFHLNREVDESGVSGTGVVAVGVILPSGKAIIEWTTTQAGVPGLGIYDDIAGLEKIHGHGGATEIVFDDEE